MNGRCAGPVGLVTIELGKIDSLKSIRIMALRGLSGAPTMVGTKSELVPPDSVCALLLQSPLALQKSTQSPPPAVPEITIALPRVPAMSAVIPIVVPVPLAVTGAALALIAARILSAVSAESTPTEICPTAAVPLTKVKMVPPTSSESAIFNGVIVSAH